jgi:LPXTG-motif cell wall-anchored protein
MALLPRTGSLTVPLLAVLSLLLGLLGLTGLVVTAPPANAEPGFRFWGYYHLQDGAWAASNKGADGFTPEDGTVEGFRYATTTGSVVNRPPRALPTFQDICADTEAGQGQKRVGLVVDYGTGQDAAGGATPPQPEALCAVAPNDASAQQMLESAAQVRVEQGLICAIEGYPASGCAEQVANARVPRNEQQVDLTLPSETQQSAADADESSVTMPLVGVGAIVLLLGGGALLLARRRRS